MTVPSNRSDALHDRELPILAELEAELGLELRALAQLEREALVRTPVARETPIRTPARVVRRALALVALISLVGGSALAGQAVLDGSRPLRSGPALLSSGGYGADRWQLEAYVYEGSVCYALFVANTVSSACGGPGANAVRVTSALGLSQRFVAGLAGADVAQVRLRVGDRDLLLATHAPAHPASARRAKLSAGLRWFVAGLPGGAARQEPARVTPLDTAGRPLAPATLDCSLGAGSSLCQQAAGRLSGVGNRRSN